MCASGSAPATPPNDADGSLTDALKARASQLGFARVGVAAVEPLAREASALRAWLQDGCHGQMGYMERTAEVRTDPRHPGMLPGARSIVALATPYARNEARVGPAPGRVARYARGRDYHNVLGKRARKLAAFLREAGWQARGSVDTLPVLERAWAQRAGIGFVGKNTCLIVPGLGSHVLLSAVVTDAVLRPDAPMKERCGSCTACLDACPTEAFEGVRRMDARRCISYLTIEHRGPIDEHLRTSMGDWIFGCDACQDVCPYNRTRPPAPETTAAFAADARWARYDAAGVLRMTPAQFDAFAQGSPIKRPGREGMARNVAVVLGNRGGRRHLPVLREAARKDASETVRDAAAWAVRQVEAREEGGGT